MAPSLRRSASEVAALSEWSRVQYGPTGRWLCKATGRLCERERACALTCGGTHTLTDTHVAHDLAPALDRALNALNKTKLIENLEVGAVQNGMDKLSLSLH